MLILVFEGIHEIAGKTEYAVRAWIYDGSESAAGNREYERHWKLYQHLGFNLW